MEETLAINQMGENAQPADPPYVHLVQDQMYQVASKLVVVNRYCCNFSSSVRLMVMGLYCDLQSDHSWRNGDKSVSAGLSDRMRHHPAGSVRSPFAVHYRSVANSKHLWYFCLNFEFEKRIFFWKLSPICHEIAKVGNTVNIGDVSASPWRTRTDERIGRVIILLLLQNLFASWNYSEQAMAPKSSNRTLFLYSFCTAVAAAAIFFCPSTAFLLHVLSQNTIVPLDFWKCEKNFS